MACLWRRCGEVGLGSRASLPLFRHVPTALVPRVPLWVLVSPPSPF
jgi:hypothetical protein